MSLRARLLIATGIIALLALSLADVATYSALKSTLIQRVDQSLDQSSDHYVHFAALGLIPVCATPTSFDPENGTPAQDPDGNKSGHGAPPSNAVQAQGVAILSASGKVAASCPAYLGTQAYTPAVPTPLPKISSNPNSATYLTVPSTKASGPEFRIRISSLLTPAGNAYLVLAQPLNDTDNTLHQLLVIELAVTGGAILLALAVAWGLIGIGLRPLRDMEATAETIAAGNLTERVPGDGKKTEMGRLARTLNVMLGRIESAFAARVASEEQLRRFVADASHELRTPIAAVSAYAELFSRGASEHKADLDRVMTGIQKETARMERLVADLLLLARLDEGQPLERSSFDLVTVCADAVQTAGTVGPQWPVTFFATEPVEIVGDPNGIRQVVDNLLGNIRAHTPEGTTGTVSVTRQEDGAVLQVSDNGPGMTDDQVHHVFERFFRADPSRARSSGGSGLGLSIVSAIVEANGGHVEASSTLGQGTTFTVRLPATAPDHLSASIHSHSTGDMGLDPSDDPQTSGS